MLDHYVSIILQAPLMIQVHLCHVLSLAGMGAHVSSVIQVLLTHFGSSAIEPKGGI